MHNVNNTDLQDIFAETKHKAVTPPVTVGNTKNNTLLIGPKGGAIQKPSNSE